MDRGAWWATVHAVAESNMTEQLTLSHCIYMYYLSICWHEIWFYDLFLLLLLLHLFSAFQFHVLLI